MKKVKFELFKVHRSNGNYHINGLLDTDPVIPFYTNDIKNIQNLSRYRSGHTITNSLAMTTRNTIRKSYVIYEKWISIDKTICNLLLKDDYEHRALGFELLFKQLNYTPKE